MSRQILAFTASKNGGKTTAFDTVKENFPDAIEAMLAGKPVIATGYGGNNDFMNINNSFPVKYKIIELEKDFGPYTKGNTWAEPDIDHAAAQMRYVFENQNVANKIGQKATLDIRQNMNPKVTGMEILKRIKTLHEIKNFNVLK